MPPKGRGRESHGPIEGKQGTTAQCLAHAVLSNLLYKTLLIIKKHSSNTYYGALSPLLVA